MIEKISQAWWHAPVTPTLERLRQDDSEFKPTLGYIGLKKKNKNKMIYYINIT
jgi:hypothetical protein